MGHLALQVLLVTSCHRGSPFTGTGSLSRRAVTPACLQKANDQEVCLGVAEGEGKEPVVILILSCQLVFSCGTML